MRWKSSTVSALGSSSCLSAHVSGVWIHMVAASLTMAPDNVIQSAHSIMGEDYVAFQSTSSSQQNRQSGASPRRGSVRRRD